MGYDGPKEKGVAFATPFSFGKPYMAIHILCSQKTFCYDCKIQILIFELLTKNSAGASIACGYSHKKKENEQKMNVNFVSCFLLFGVLLLSNF